jgi:DNA-3-methyladenine glycosylase II
MFEVATAPPYSLALSLRALHSFTGAAAAGRPAAADEPLTSLRLGVRLEGQAAFIEIRQPGADDAPLQTTSQPHAGPELVRPLVERVVNARLDLHPFYDLVDAHEVLGPAIRELRGLKPFRPASLLDMVISAITEQQISLAAAHHIRQRLVERFGEEVGGVPVFPRAERLASAPIHALTDCGLSLRKAEYVSGVARAVATGALDLEALESAADDQVRERLTSLRGLGPWSADYILVRGLGRVDVVPADDLGVRTVLGRLLGDGRRLDAAEVKAALAPFEPFRGLATFYLLVAWRLLSDKTQLGRLPPH